MYGAQRTKITALGDNSDGRGLVAVEQNRIITAEIAPGVYAHRQHRVIGLVSVNRDRSNSPQRALPPPRRQDTPPTTRYDTYIPPDDNGCCSTEKAFHCNGSAEWYYPMGKGWFWVISLIIGYIILVSVVFMLLPLAVCLCVVYFVFKDS